MKVNSILNYIYIIIAILWNPVREFFINIDGANRTIIIITILVCLLNIQKKSFITLFKYSTVKIWGIWVLYATLNSWLQGSFDEHGLFMTAMLLVVHPYVTMLIVMHEYIKNEKKLLQLLIYTYVCFGLLYISNLTGFQISSDERVIESFGNGQAISMTVLIFIACLAWKNGYINKVKLSFVLFISLFMIVYISTRKAFAGSMFLILVTILSSMNFKLISIIKTVVIISVLLVPVTYVLDNTVIGERFNNIEEEGNRYNKSDIDALKYLGDRAIQYSAAPKYFFENPISGIGLTNYVNKTPSYYKLHSELLVQLVELGLIGFFLFVSFHYKIASSLLEYIKKTKNINGQAFYLLCGWILVIFLSFTTWTYQFNKYFIIYGILIGELIKYENSNPRKIR
ncbi:MAG: hypothetical protein ACI93N_000307 [Flavobacteriaceae bacterium]|jgi:hypothetical protein